MMHWTFMNDVLNSVKSFRTHFLSLSLFYYIDGARLLHSHGLNGVRVKSMHGFFIVGILCPKLWIQDVLEVLIQTCTPSDPLLRAYLLLVLHSLSHSVKLWTQQQSPAATSTIDSTTVPVVKSWMGWGYMDFSIGQSRNVALSYQTIWVSISLFQLDTHISRKKPNNHLNL